MPTVPSSAPHTGSEQPLWDREMTWLVPVLLTGADLSPDSRGGNSDGVVRSCPTPHLCISPRALAPQLGEGGTCWGCCTPEGSYSPSQAQGMLMASLCLLLREGAPRSNSYHSMLY